MRLIITILFVQSFSVIFGQKVPEFETKLYFRDVLGNKDTLTVGYDPEVMPKMENAEFGEEDIQNIPWKVDFEVRGIRRDDGLSQIFPVQSKRIYGTTNGDLDDTHKCSVFPTNIDILVRHLELPITVTWDKEQFNNSFCRQGTYLAAHGAWITSPLWYLDNNWVRQASCLSKEDSLVITDFNVDGWGDSKEVLLENGQTDTVWVLRLNFRRRTTNDSPCSSISSASDYSINKLVVFPNPSSEIVRWDSRYQGNFELYSLSGELIHRGYGDHLNISRLRSGSYFIKLHADELYISPPIIKAE